MKHLKIYEEFSIDRIVTNDKKTALDKLNNDLTVFKSRKNNLKNLVLSNRNTDKDITKNIEQIVQDNRFLERYLEILNKELKVENLEDGIENTNDSLKEKQLDLTNANQIEDKEIKQLQIDKINDQIKKYKESIINDKKKISELEPEIKQMESALQKDILLMLKKAKEAIGK